MPFMCFSYPAPLPPGTGNAPVPSGPRRMPITSCFDYQADGPRIMPASCCGYSVHVPPGIGSDIAEPGLGEPRRMPYTCFRY
jgi:hypothetical protein